MHNDLLITLIASTLIQASAAWIALRQVGTVSGPYRLAWGLVSLALALMVERRVVPLWRLIAHGETVPGADAGFGLAISLLMLIGILGIRQLFLDMTRQEQQLALQARTDALTELPNRREILARLKAEIERSDRTGHPLTILMLDIDHFKQVNDAQGHIAGDRVLQALAKITQASLRRIDSCGRLGGEEFLVVLPETGPAEAQAAAERLRMAIADQPILHDGQTFRITISIGVAVRPEGATHLDMETLIRQADHALYAAKAGGRNRVTMEAP